MHKWNRSIELMIIRTNVCPSTGCLRRSTEYTWSGRIPVSSQKRVLVWLAGIARDTSLPIYQSKWRSLGTLRKQECKPKAKRQAKRAGKAPVVLNDIPSLVERERDYGIHDSFVSCEQFGYFCRGRRRRALSPSTGRSRVGGHVADTSTSSAAAAAAAAASSDPCRRERQGDPQAPIQGDGLICMNCLPVVATVGIRTCGLNCGATICELHLHSRSIRGQSVSVCGDCLPHTQKLHKVSQVFFANEGQKRLSERNLTAAEAAGGKR
eukprot:2065367-Amphidinium_carterae.3